MIAFFQELVSKQVADFKIIDSSLLQKDVDGSRLAKFSYLSLNFKMQRFLQQIVTVMKRRFVGDKVKGQISKRK